jgi:hypothetical protein
MGRGGRVEWIEEERGVKEERGVEERRGRESNNWREEDNYNKFKITIDGRMMIE